MASDIASYKLEVAFNENVAGVFTVDGSAMSGTDGLTDVGQFAGTFDDITLDAQAPYEVVFGTDNLMSAVQPASLTVTVARVDEPDYWNPNNPASPLNTNTPGFVPMRPVRLTADVDGVTYGIFRGFLRHATWKSKDRSCELYCEDFLLWASRVYPTIASTGPTNMGAVFKLLVAAVDPTLAPIADTGISLPDFSADGTRSVTQLIADLLTVDLGTVYVNSDGIPVYEQHDTPLARPAVATIVVADHVSEEQSGIDLDAIRTRATATQTDAAGTVLSSVTVIDADSEKRYGRADYGEVSSPNVGNPSALANELVYEGVQGKQPLQFTLANVDNATLLLMLTTPPLYVFTINDSFGGSVGDVIIQQIRQTFGTGLHEAQYLTSARPTRAFTVDGSALDGPDALRYP